MKLCLIVESLTQIAPVHNNALCPTRKIPYFSAKKLHSKPLLNEGDSRGKTGEELKVECN